MAKATTKASSLTTLVIGNVEVPVGLFSTVAKSGHLAEFATAGPNGGVLKAHQIARPVPVDVPSDAPDQPVHSDPLADEVTAEEQAANLERFREVFPADRPWMVGQPEPADGTGGDIFEPPEPRVQVDADVVRAATAGPPEGIITAGGGYQRVAVPRPSDEPSDEAITFPAVTATGRESVGLVGADVDGEYGRQLVEEGTDEVVLPQDIRRGVRLEDGRFIDCTEQLATIDERTKLDTMTVIGFVDFTNVPRTRVKGAYYLGALDEQSPRALRIVFEGLKARRRAALVKLTKRTRQTLGVIAAVRDSLMLFELVWAEDFRPAPPRATRIQKESVSEREVALFSELIDAMALGPKALDELRDDALALREELHAAALAGEVPDVVVPPAADAGQDRLLRDLEASLAGVS